MKVYIVTGHSKNGNSYGPEVFTKKLTEELLKNLITKWEDTINNGGPIDDGSRISLKVTEKELMEE